MSAAVKYIDDISISPIFWGDKYRYRIHIGKGDIVPTLNTCERKSFQFVYYSMVYTVIIAKVTNYYMMTFFFVSAAFVMSTTPNFVTATVMNQY